MLSYNKDLKQLSRNLRKGMTAAEKVVWSNIRRKQLKGHQFYRQKIIGDYIVDFYCPKAKLIIEIDGGQHYDSEGKEKDRIRDKEMGRIGITILRFSNRDVLTDLEAVLRKIWSDL